MSNQLRLPRRRDRLVSIALAILCAGSVAALVWGILTDTNP